MSVEAYALVTFPGLRTDFEKSFDKHMKEQGLTRAMLTNPDPVLKLCHVKLVQPLGKNGSCPKPKWEVVEEILTVYRENGDEAMKVWNQKFFYAYGNGEQVPTDKGKLYSFSPIPRVLLGDFYYGEYEENEMVPPVVEEIDDRRIQLKHIKQLFPECAKMQLAIALDYVRDRIYT